MYKTDETNSSIQVNTKEKNKLSESKTKKAISNISKTHFLKLFGRLTLFALAIVAYILQARGIEIFGKIFSYAVTAIFTVEMVLRMVLPQSLESMGCQKAFKKNYLPSGEPHKNENRGVLATSVIWIVGNALVFIILKCCNLLIDPILMIMSMFYAVCDMICVLWFCPFQRWLMGNRCCNTCRIYNWDYIMMFTPLVCIPTVTNYILFGTSLIVLIAWETTHIRHPERFSPKSNCNLNCNNCKEKRCRNNKFNKLVTRKFH